LLVTLLSPLPAHALSEPSPSPRDEHVRTVAYDPQNRIHLTIQQGGVTNITFGPMELIDHVVSADSAPFDYPQKKKEGAAEAGDFLNNLPIIGKTPGTGSLVVITRGAPPNDKERAYNFAVRTVAAPPGGDDPAVTYQLNISYAAQFQAPIPVDLSTPKATSLSWKEKKALADYELATARLRADVGYGPQNRNYIAQGRERAIVPLEAFDNGQLTAFRFPGNMAQPAIFKVIGQQNGLPPATCQNPRAATDLEAMEEAVNTRVVNDLVIIDHTAPHWRIRSGEAVADIDNCGYTVPITPSLSGTQSPDVVRRIVAK
jgi:type IV secretion system protein VirB9